MVIYPSSFTFASVPVSSPAIAVACPERSAASVSAVNRSFRTGILHRQLLYTAMLRDIGVSSRRMEDRRRDRIGGLQPIPWHEPDQPTGLRMSVHRARPE